MKKIRPNKNTWYNWLINYIPESIRKSARGSKDKIASLFKGNPPKQTVYRRGKTLSKPKKRSKPKIKKTKQNFYERLIKNRLIRDIRILFEQDERRLL